MAMLKGPAVDGPCQGARLEADYHWDGRVRDEPGRYAWDWDFQAWIWHEYKPVESKVETPSPKSKGVSVRREERKRW